MKIRLASTLTSIGTWYVRSLIRCRKLEEFSRELDNYKVVVNGILEAKCPGTGEVTTDNDYKLFYIGQDKVKK